MFERLDVLRQKHAVIWIASPPGAGKTTLAASYLVNISTPSIWCQIDQGDADPATLFFFLTEAVRGTQPPLPFLAPELANDVPRFARLFFREFYARLAHDTVVVFDNIQEFDWNNSGELMEIAFTEIPEGITVLALSRDAPPARLARLELSGRLATLGWSELRLNNEEARTLARLDEIAPHSRMWLERIDGWAAGIVMLRQHLVKHRDEAEMPLLEGRDAVFRYFAGEILERMSKPCQHLLLLLSYLPGFSTTDAEQLTQDPAAARLLGRLYRNRWFVDRRDTTPFTYHFHALFREFLQYEAQQRLDPHERAQLLERAAAILDAQGRTDEAARLYHDAGAHAQLAHLLLRCAGRMVASGRGQTWREWMGWLPPAMVDGEPWFGYWQGASLNHVNPVLGRQALEQAERAFHAAGDVRARLLSIAAIIDGYYYEWADFQALPNWIDAMLEALQSLDLDSLDPETDLKIHSRLTLALFLTTDASPLFSQSTQRALQVLPNVDNPAEQLAAAALLLNYLNWMDAVAARRLVAMLNHLADGPGIAPLHRISWLRSVVYRHQLDGNHQTAHQMLLDAERLANKFGLTHFEFQLNFRLGLNFLSVRNLNAAKTLLDDMQHTLPQDRKLDLTYLRVFEAIYFAQAGNAQAGRQAVEDAVRIAAEIGIPATTRCQIHVLAACCCIQAGDIAAARAWVAKAMDHAYGEDKEFAADAQRFVAGYAHHVTGDQAQAIRFFTDLLGNQRKNQINLQIAFACLPQLSSVLFGVALREGIEVEFVRSIIGRLRLPPPNRFTPNWPWPIAIRSLGKMELSLNGGIVTPAGKAQQRPLMLLKALLVSGDAGKAQQVLATQLWPDADDPRASLNVTIHRLRKLLGNDEAVVVAAGKVMLAGTRVWSDIAALAEVCDRIETLPEQVETTEVNHLAMDLLNLYQGPFCDGDDESWLLAARDRWRNRFLVAVTHLGQRLEHLHEWLVAQQLYLRALDAEPLAEAIYRGLMRCAHAQNDPAAAFSTYRRCRDTLSIILGHQPSPETEKLANTLGLK